MSGCSHCGNEMKDQGFTRHDGKDICDHCADNHYGWYAPVSLYLPREDLEWDGNEFQVKA
jgi:recombinational DNA repair protein (RecF pathway)